MTIKEFKLGSTTIEVDNTYFPETKEENEKVLNKVLKKFNAKIVPIEKIEGIEYLPVEIEGTLCISPTELYEGFFVAKIRK